MPLLRGLRLLEAVETGNTTASCLDSLLTSDRGRYSDFSSVMVLPGQAQVIAASNIAMTCITGSNTATCALFSYPTTSSAVLNSYTASCVLFNGPNSANVVSIMGNSTGAAQGFVNSVPGCSCIISNCSTLQSISSPTFVSYFKGCRAIAGGFYGCANVASCWSTAQSFCACTNYAGNAPQTLIATGVFGYWNPNACTYTIGYLNSLTYCTCPSSTSP